jgi:hypothetical protein
MGAGIPCLTLSAAPEGVLARFARDGRGEVPALALAFQTPAYVDRFYKYVLHVGAGGWVVVTPAGSASASFSGAPGAIFPLGFHWNQMEHLCPKNQACVALAHTKWGVTAEASFISPTEKMETTTEATIKETKAPTPVYKCSGCSKHFEVPASCLKTFESLEEVHYKIYETKKYLGWECPSCHYTNKKPSKDKYNKW